MVRWIRGSTLNASKRPTSLTVKDGEKMYQWPACKEVKRSVENYATGSHFIVRCESSSEGVEDVRRVNIWTGPQGLYSGWYEPS